MTTTNFLSDSGPSLSGECSVDGNSHESDDARVSEDQCSSHDSQDDVDSTPKEKKVERKSKSMPIDIQRGIDILRENSKEIGDGSVHFLSDREDDSAEMDALIWGPPEPEDDMEGGVTDAEEDDDDECSKWGTSSGLGESKDESSRKRNSSEENPREMLKMAHSKFKFLVNQVIKSAGFSKEEGESWTEIVARLCWEAAALLKPPSIDGKPVDPTEYIKVKCIATGSCNESEVFKGLVFNKHAALKHMPTNYEHPRIMLVEGVLGQPLSGFSSLRSMDKDFNVKDVVDIIKALKPDVILVEKSVSRDIQWSILRQMVTLVLDMKLHRLRIISRCIGSPIMPLDSQFSQKLKHCDSFRIEKVSEEHNVVGEDKKKPTKTLMFLEGCPTFLGCTILLKGSHTDQLKKVKEVVQYSFILAFHLILEASFLADQQTMLSTIFTKEASSCVAETEKSPLSSSLEAFDEQSIQTNGEKDGETVLESASILVLVSNRNSLMGVTCDQRHLLRIAFYKHFDVPLESFLRSMFNQRSRCQKCEESPEAHMYYYGHHNKQLTIQIKRIPVPKCLSGEAQGKIWMWSRYKDCNTKNGAWKSTKRVLMSTAALNLSFGKFLELSFTQHSLERDFLHFFGLGSMVAILSYSQVTSYTVSLPPMMLEPSILIKVGWLEEEFLRVFTKGISLFEDAASFLERLRSQFKNLNLSYHCSLKFISHIEEVLNHERCGYEENFKISFNKAKTINDLLGLNRTRWELLLQALVWNYRLQSLVLSDRLKEADSLDGVAAASNGSNILGWDEWFWRPFEDLRSKPIVDIEKEYLLKFEYVNNFTQENLQTVNQIITEEGSRLRIPVRGDDFIVSDYEDELSSLIACALAHLSNADDILEIPPPPEVLVTFGSLESVGKPKYSIMCLYGDEFRDLRKRCCSSELDYIASLSRCKPAEAKDVFAKTLDDRFIVKEIKKTEYESFVKFAPEYFKYMKDSYDLGNQTCLAKVLGIHQVTVRQPKSGKEIRHNLMVMENLRFGRNFITRQYDLKGSLHARFYASSANGLEDVLLDQNFVNDMISCPLYVSETSKQNLQRAIYNDTAFLTSINMMDYSLLVGVDDESHEVVCGIIGYFRQYTWDKQIETWMKSSLVVPKNVQPTVISPIDYKTRFRKFMKTHFLCLPDKWCNPV